METFNFIGTSTVFQHKWGSKHSFLSCSEQDHRTPLITDARNLSSSLSPHSNTLHLPMEYWEKKSAQRSPSDPSQQSPQALTCVIKHDFPLVFKEIYETNITLTGLDKISNSNTNNSPKKNMAHHLFFAIYRSFRTRIHSYLAWMIMQAP